jgi:hypothetical protein
MKKLLRIGKNSANDPLLFGIRAIAMFPGNRIVTPLCYLFDNPNPEHGTALFEHYPLGDLVQWKSRDFDKKNKKIVPESYIWRFVLQVSQALALSRVKSGQIKSSARSCSTETSNSTTSWFSTVTAHTRRSSFMTLAA